MLELVIVVALVSILSAIAVPQFSLWAQSNRLNSGSLSIRFTLMLARSSAITKNSNVVVAFSTSADGSYTVFVDEDGDYSQGSDEEVLEEGTMPTGISLYLTDFEDDKACYNPMGIPDSDGTVYLKDSAAGNVRQIILAATGNVKIEAGP